MIRGWRTGRVSARCPATPSARVGAQGTASRWSSSIRPGQAGAGPVLALELLSQDMVPVAGGKAANLGELLRAGLPVPGGFCLTTHAYRRAMAPAGLEETHRALAACAPERSPGAGRTGRHGPRPGPGRRGSGGDCRRRPCRLCGAGDRRRRRGQIVRHRRGPGVRQFRRTAGHLPERGGRGGGAGRRPAVLGLAVDGPGRGVPCRPGDRPRYGVAGGGGPAHGGCGRRRRALHGEPGDRPAARGGHRCQPGTGRGGGLRRRQPGPLCGGRRHPQGPGAPDRGQGRCHPAAARRRNRTCRPAGCAVPAVPG